MTPSASLRPPARRGTAWVVLAAFLVLSLVSALQSYLSARAGNEDRPFGAMLLYGMAGWAAWLLLVPPIIWLGRRFDFARGRLLASIAVHALAVLGSYVITMTLLVWLGIRIFNPDEPFTRAMLVRTLLASSRLSMVLAIYAVILVIDRALRLWQALAVRETQAVRARLDVLAARLQPHFLFNALQSVSALVDEDPPRARRMLAQLGDLLRDALAEQRDGMVTLAEEIALLRRYLAIEEVRFADRLRVEVDLGPGTEAVPVPRFLLQPLAENAIRHGLAPRPEGGRLRVRARRTGDTLELSVWNDGAPLAARVSDGVGLATTRERLATTYRDRATLLLCTAERGVEARVTLPA